MDKLSNNGRCPCCKKTFKQLKRHISKNLICQQHIHTTYGKTTTSKLTEIKEKVPIEEFETNQCDYPFMDDNIQSSSSLFGNLYESYTDEKESHFNCFPDGTNAIKEQLVLEKQQYIKNSQHHLPTSTIARIKLLKILKDLDAPLYAYNSIMDWSAECSNLGISFTHNYPSRQHLINRMSDMMCMTGMQPKETSMKLSDDRMIKVTHFDFKQMCISILNDRFLMNDNNLTFVNDNPCVFKRCEKDCQKLSCVEDGSVFQNTAKRVCLKQDDLCLGIKLFIDATHTDIHGNWMLDPVMFTFTFFNNEVTKSESAWRPLGFITEFGQHKIKNGKSISSSEKLQDFHSQLKIIFSSLKECQEKGGFLWDLDFRNRTFRVNMKPIILLIVGDAQGNHKLAGMYGKFTEVNRVNHSCNCPWTQTDNETFKCSFMKHSDIKHLCEKGDEHALNLISQHNIQNAFDIIDIGYHPAGINALMPSEILHQMFLGLIEYALKAFFGEFGNISKKKIDNYGKTLFTRFQHNSDRSIPVRYFRDGFTKMTKQKGSDKIGLSIIVICCMYSRYKDVVVEGCRIGPTTQMINSYIIIIEYLIILSEWLCSDIIEVSSLEQVNRNIIYMMKLYKNTVRRDSIHGMKISKFHELLHIVRDIRLFGPPKGYDGRPGESSHKQTKQLARQTQKRVDYFENQTGKRMYESLVINKMFDEFVSDEITDKNSFNFALRNNKKRKTSSYLIMSKDRGICHPLIEDISKTSTIFQDSCQYVYDTIGIILDSNAIPILPYIKVNDNIQIHCHPWYKMKEEWFDWILIKWEYANSDIQYVPARVMQILDLRSIDGKIADHYEPGIYLCIISLKRSTKKVGKSHVIYKGAYERMEDHKICFRIVEISSVHSFCFAVPDCATLEDKDILECDQWLFVENRRDWAKHFLHIK